MASFSDYQQQYMEQRLGKDWGTSCGGAGAKGGRTLQNKQLFTHSFMQVFVGYVMP